MILVPLCLSLSLDICHAARRAFRCQCTDLQSGAASQPALISNHSRCMATSAIASTVAVACGVLRHILRVAPWPVFSPTPTSWRVPSSRLLSAGRSLALVVFEPRLHELVEFLHLFVGVGFWRAVFQPTEHVSFD